MQMTYTVVMNQQYVLLCERLFAYVTFVGPVRIQVFLEWIIYTFVFTWNNKEKNQLNGPEFAVHGENKDPISDVIVRNASTISFEESSCTVFMLCKTTFYYSV